MPEAVYELAALAMRYVIIALAALVVLRAGYVTLLGFKGARGAGVVVGRLKVTALPRIKDEQKKKRAMSVGRELPIGRDVLIGSSRRCDVRLPFPAVKKIHAQLWEKDGIFFLSPVQGKVKVGGHSAGRNTELAGGDKLSVGPVEFELIAPGEAGDADE